MSLSTVALELVPANTDRSRSEQLDEARKIVRLSGEAGVAERIGHVMIPGMIDERVANIAERKSGQAIHRVVGRHATLRHVEHQLAKRVGVHDPHARTR